MSNWNGWSVGEDDVLQPQIDGVKKEKIIIQDNPI